jgi:hypothetical protein
MKPIIVGVSLLSLALLAAPARAQDPDEEDLAPKVRKAIDRGVKYLRGLHHNGDWEHQGLTDKPGAVTTLTVLALLNAGVPPEDPLIQNGLKSIRQVKPTWTYVVALQTMVYALARQPVDKERIQKNVNWLIDARVGGKGGVKFQGWGYKADSPTADNSNTQYALLGLHEGHLAGAKIDQEVWESILQYYQETQDKSGGWGYKREMLPSPTMTTAGLCGILIASNDKRSNRKNCPPEECGKYDEDRNITKAIDFIGRTMLPGDKIENQPHHLFYYLYGLERAGRLSGRRFLGGHDWYRVGCRFLIKDQNEDGSWQGRNEESHPANIISTCFALLFLSKGRTPVLISKLAYGDEDSQDWSNDRNDAKNLVDFCSRALFKDTPLAWQVFDLRDLRDLTQKRIRELTGELLESPITYITGHRAPRLSGGHQQILREYVNNGGFIMAEACCGRGEFDRGFRQLMREMFPDNALEPLPADHPVWTASGRFVSRPSDFELEGVRLGCKWVVIYSRGTLKGQPDALCCHWEVNRYEAGRGQEAFQLGANIIAYATGLEPPRPRGSWVEVPRDDADKKVPRGAVAVGQIRHDGDWHPAPKAMRNVMREIAKEGIDVALKTAELSIDDKNLIDYKFLYMHGRKEFQFGARELEELRFNLKEGGALLFADACCGSKTFDKSFRKFVAQLLPEHKLEVIPLLDELYSKDLNGAAITQVRCRRQAPDGSPERGYRAVDPYLEGVKIDGRWVVIYSKYDIGCALENNKSSDCLGHDHDSAMVLAKAAVFYALKR